MVGGAQKQSISVSKEAQGIEVKMQRSQVKLCSLLFTERWNSAQSLARDYPRLGLLYVVGTMEATEGIRRGGSTILP